MPEQAADRHPAQGPVRGVDDIDVEEQLRHVLAGLQEVVEGLADGPELGRGGDLALHQAAGGLVLVGERGLDGRPVDVGQGRQHLGALVGLQVLHQVDGVVGVHLAQGPDEGGGGHALQEVLADLRLDLGEDLGQGLGVEVGHHLLAVGGRQEAHQVGDVGGVQGGQQLAQALGVAAVGGVHHKGDEVGIEGVVVAEGEVLEVLGGGRGEVHVIAQGMFGVAAHADLPSRRYA